MEGKEGPCVTERLHMVALAEVQSDNDQVVLLLLVHLYTNVTLIK